MIADTITHLAALYGRRNAQILRGHKAGATLDSLAKLHGITRQRVHQIVQKEERRQRNAQAQARIEIRNGSITPIDRA